MSLETRKEIGSTILINELFLYHGYTKVTMAEDFKLAQSTIYNVLFGKRRTTKELLKKFSCLGNEIDDLLEVIEIANSAMLDIGYTYYKRGRKYDSNYDALVFMREYYSGKLIRKQLGRGKFKSILIHGKDATVFEYLKNRRISFEKFGE